MSPNKFNPEEWGRRLEAGERNDPALLLAAQVEQSRPAVRPLDGRFKENLRRRLLTQADVAPAHRLGQVAVSLAVMALLVTAVALFWASQAANQPALPGAADEDAAAAAADAVALTLTDREGELAELELELRELEAAAASWQIAPLRQSAADGRLLIDTTLTYDPAAPPPTITLLLGPASWRGGGDVNRDEAVETAVLNPADIAAAEGEIAVRFTVDPLAVWERFNDYELVLAAQIEYETADGAVVVSAIERQLTLQVAWLDDLWLNSVTPEPGTPLDNASFTVELGYRLLSAPAADIRLLVAHPTWESVNLGAGGRLPVNGAGDSASVTRGEGTLTFTFTTEDAAYLHEVIGAEATLAAHMLVPGADGVMQALVQKTFADYTWPVADFADHVWPVADEAAKTYCPVTLPTDSPFTAPSPHPPHAPYADRFWYGTESLWTMLPTDGAWQHRGEKIWWWREGYNGQEEQRPELSMTAVRLDSPAAPAIEIDPPATNGYHADFHWAMLSGLYLPSGGCWQITGHYHDHELSFVVWVTDYVWTPDRLWFVDIAPPPGTTIREGDTVVVTLGYELHTAAEGSISVAWSHAEWDGPNPPTTAFGWQTITAGTGQIELEFTADDLAALQSRAGQFVRLTATLGASDEQNQYRRLADAAWEDAPWQLGTVMAGVPRMMPQVAVFPDNRDTAVTRLDILNIESGASFATGMTPITFTVELAYQLASRQAEEAIVTIYIAAAGTGARVPLALVAETVQAGRGIIEATFDFNPQRDLNESQRRLPRSFELVITIDRQDGTLLTYTGTSADWEFRP